MQIKFIASLLAVATMVSANANTPYTHTHSGTQRQLTNTNVNFGSPAQENLSSRNFLFKFDANAKGQSGDFGVSNNEKVRFDLENTSQQAVAFVLGDEAAVSEYAQLFRKDPNSVRSDFHGVILAPGEKKSFAWQFDTFGAPKVVATYVTLDGEYQQRQVPVTVHKSRDR